jgi:hypothetical protein
MFWHGDKWESKGSGAGASKADKVVDAEVSRTSVRESSKQGCSRGIFRGCEPMPAQARPYAKGEFQ